MQAEIIEGFRLSPEQKRLWSLQAVGSPLMSSFELRLSGALDSRTLEEALRRVVEKHEILRTTFQDFESMELPLQVVAEGEGVRYPELRISEAGGAGPDEGTLDLHDGPLLHCTLTSASPEEHLLTVRLPSVCADLESLKNLARDLVAAYEAGVAGGPFADEVVQYVQYSEWRNEVDEEEGVEKTPAPAEAGERVAPRLSLERSGPETVPAVFAARTVSFAVPEEIEAEVAALAEGRGADPESVWLAFWQALLWRLAGRSEIAIGYVFDGRPFEELVDSIGPFARVVPLELRLAGDHRFEELLGAISDARREIVEGDVRGASPEEAGGALAIQFEAVRAPSLSVDGLEIRLQDLEATVDRFRLKLSYLGRDDGSELRLSFDPSAYSEASVEHLGRCLTTLAQDALADPERRLDRLALLSDEDRESLLVDFNATERAVEAPLVPRWLEEVCGESSGPAVVAPEGSLSFAELSRDAGRLSVHLESLGIGPEDRVVVCLRPSCRLVVALAGVLGAGAAYVPVDPDDPPRRLEHVLRDAAPRLVVGSSDTLAVLETGEVETLALDAAWEEIVEGAGDRRPAARVEEDHLAYLIYTSGSTGAPKGTCVTHRGLANYLSWACREYAVAEGGGSVLHSPVTFDLSVTSLFAPLLAGRPVRVLPPSPDPADLVAALEEEETLSFLKLTPTHLDLMGEHLGPETAGRPRVLIVGGEALHAEQVAPWRERAPGVRIVNEYGPTETVVGCTVHEVDEEDPGSGPVPIGRPVANTRVYVLDERMQPVPRGVQGELYVGGAGVARGYHGRPALTAERFVPDPYGAEPGQRLYRTGDAVRFMAENGLEFVGRLDHQVKIRGHRVELGEIESVLRGHPEVREAVAVLREDDGGEPRLTAYLVAGEGAGEPSVSALREYLLERVPEPMVPARFVVLDALPLARSGKVDRAALPEPDDSRDHLGARYRPPQSLTEEVLCTIWSEVLGVDRVGVDDDYFALGGDSIRSIRVRSLAAERGLSISNQDLFRHQTVGALARHVRIGSGAAAAELTPTQPFELISEADRSKLPEGVEDAYPLAALQAGMVFHSELEPDSAVFHDLHVLDLTIPFDRPALEQALDHLFERHPVLRAAFDLTDSSEPLLLVHRDVPVPLDVEDVRDLPDDEQTEYLERRLEEEKADPFDWTRAPLLRFQVYRRSDRSCRFVFSFHHAVLDGWSVATLLTELFTTYLSFLEGSGPPELPELSVGYRDFVALERQTLESPEARSFWRERLEDAPVLPLPRSRSSDAGEAAGIHIEQVDVPIEVSEKLEELSRSLSIPLKSILLAAHLRVLAHWTGRFDVLTGLVSNGRPEASGGDRVTGLFLNTLPFRVRLDAESWAELARRVFEIERDMLPHRRYPLSALQQETGGRTLFDTAFNFMHYHVYQSLEGLRDDVELEGWDGYEETNFPLTANFSLDLATSHIDLWLNCHPTELGRDRIEELAQGYAAVLAAMAAEPDGDFRTLDLLTPTETERRGRFNATEARLEAPLVSRWLEEVCGESSGPAVVAPEGSLSFAELSRDAGRLSVHLESLGIGPEDRVVVCLRPSCRLVVALAGVLGAGAAYVPVDPDDPPRRLEHVLRDAAPRLVVGSSDTLAVLETGEVETLALDAAWEEIVEGAGDRRPAARVEEDHLAYLIYTSGSTGAPKGTCVTHRGLANYLSWACRVYAVAEGGGSVLHSPVTFDLSVTSLFAPLLAGRPVRVLPPSPDPADLVAALEEEEETLSFLKLTPTHLDLMGEHLGPETAGRPRVLIVGGEALHAEQVAPWRERAPGVRIVNEYGPTETVVGCTVHEVDEEDPGSGPVPIGRPVANTRVYVLDEWMQPVPRGVQGELYVGGAGVARGYHGRPALTAERFVPDPYGAEPGQRLYRTGDAVRFMAENGLEFVGRLDHQVKIRGHRVELGEIESVLRGHPEVREAVAVLREDDGGEPRLTAYLVAGEGAGEPSVSALREYLLERVPEPMVPARFVVLDALPLARSGKVDRAALPEPDRSRPDLDGDLVEPRNEVEQTLAGIWAEVLGLEQVGVRDNFFQLGGHSLPAIQVVSRIRRALGVDLPLRQLFDAPTIERLAERLEAIRAGGGGAAGGREIVSRHRERPVEAVEEQDLDALLDEIEALDEDQAASRAASAQVPEADVNPLTYDQERVWNLERDNPGHFRYTMSFMFRLRGPLEEGALARSVDRIVQRHEVLRSTFPLRDGEPVQLVSPRLEIPMAAADLTGLPAGRREGALQRQSAVAARTPFDLERGPLVRAVLYQVGSDEHVLLMIMHAIVMDGWSMGILLGELQRLYQADVQGQAPDLPDLEVQVADYARWERRRIGRERLPSLLDYWLEQLPGPLHPMQLPGRRDREASERGATRTLELPDSLAQRIREFGREQGVTPFMTALAGFKLFLHRHNEREDVWVGVGVAQRNRVETEALIGSFMNILLFRTDFSDDPSFEEALQRVRDVTLGAFAHQELPWVELVRALRREGRLLDDRPTRVMVDHMTGSPGTYRVGELEVTPVAPDRELVTGSDMCFRLHEGRESMTTTMFYKPDLFAEETIMHALEEIHDLLRRGLDEPSTPLSKLLESPRRD